MKKIVFFIFFLFNIVVVSAQKDYNALIYEGNRAFGNGDYAGASSKFLKASKGKDKDFTAIYNLANSLYKDKKYNQAISEYQKVGELAKTSADKVASLYNLGNAYMQSGNNQKAAEVFKKALKLAPENEKIRKNYEISKRKQEDNQHQNSTQQKNENRNNNPKDNNQDSKEKDEKQGKNSNGNENSTQQGKNNGGIPQQKNDNSESKLPKDIENALLNQIKEKEQETTRRILNKNSVSVPRSREKDW